MKWGKVVSWLLALSLALPAGAPGRPAAALESEGAQAAAQDSGGYAADSYRRYLEDHPADDGQAVPEIILTADHLAGVEGEGLRKVDKDGKRAVECLSGNMATWSFTVQQTGWYNLEVEYLAVDGTGGAMERNLYIDGQVPFNEARGILFKREFTYGEERIYNVAGNEIQPEAVEIRKWRKRTVTSPAGYIVEPLRFYLTAGEHTLGLEAVREPILYGMLRLYRQEQAPTYEQAVKQYEEAGYTRKGLDSLHLDAERPGSVSDVSLYPSTDRSSAYTQPPSADKLRLNVLGGDNWKTPGQYVRYNIHVETEGLYAIGFRYKQDISQGMSVYRRLTIDGQLPFQEAAALKFTYDSGWQSEYAGEGGDAYLFYLSAGDHELTLEATGGGYAEVLSALNDSLTALNGIYRSLLMITGPEPDINRDYSFKKLIPETVEQMGVERDRLAEVLDQIARISENNGSQVTVINTLIVQLGKMYDKPEKAIAENLESFQSNLSALGTWIMNATSQPLMLDTIVVGPEGTELPAGDTGFFSTLWFECQRFVASFFNDYALASTVEDGGMESIDVWIATGRDQAQIVRNLIDSSFVPQENVMANLKLVAAGTLMPAILADKGPDVSLGAVSTEPINLAVRGAALDLTQFSDCRDIFERFHQSAMTAFTFKDAVYALPETQSFLMMFYREDILGNLGIQAPGTWDDLFDCMLELQTNNLSVGLPPAYMGVLLFLMQNGGSLYSEDSATSLLDTDIALSSFKQFTDYYALYDFPVQYDFANRFRSGEMPIAIQEYTAYNQLLLFAPEIKGLWRMAPVPATKGKDGTLHRESLGTVTGCVILKDTDNPEASWRFLKWWTSAEVQGSFGTKMESVLGEAAKYATANMEALEKYSWSYNDLTALQTAWKNVVGIPEVPGGYYTQRYIEFAFNKVMSGGADPVETLEGYVPTITAELRRKLKEFGY